MGFRPVGPILLEGLKKLEYRGYDSCGVASVSECTLQVRKGVGKIDDVEKAEKLSQITGNASLSHSRWATHGGVTKENAHPHTDCSEKIALVHNGIIENFQSLRKKLTDAGHVFRSQTDTEAIAHLVESESGSLEERVRKAVLCLEGSFALLVLSSDEPDKLIAVRKESPMAVGLGKGEFFAASDVMPFLSHARDVVFLEDGEMASLSRFGVTFSDVLTGKPFQKKPRTLDWNEESASKGGFDHFMLKEILEQPSAIRSALVQKTDSLNRFLALLKSSRQIKLVACGTSRHAALVGRYLFSRLANLSAEVYIASEFSYFADQCTADDLVVCVSQSGETADVLVGLRKAKVKG
ncbi:MAG TPA: isomerizing glutamine--fructose-6-phosphate transaminase, partial [Candidatus Norongarragalinales archaeon]|nr:isomerizing glutamine--fructose-6-phosphate transaminase [Candidatus Norongarragalinales archaeon]